MHHAAYDLAGNITTLTRNGPETYEPDPTYDVIDQLTYNYPANSSVLTSIDEGGSASMGLLQGGGYTHDNMGNILSGKGYTSAFNLLNLPYQSNGTGTSMSIDYTYGGAQIKKDVSDSSDPDEENHFEYTKHYIGAMEFTEDDRYDDTQISFNHGDGRILWDQEENEWRFQYKISDHLGNTVVLFEDRKGEDGARDGKIDPTRYPIVEGEPDKNEVLQRHYYYPFGMELVGDWSNNASPDCDYRYNGKELHKDGGLNWYMYGARMYDPQIGRFSGVDPIADQFAWVSPFNYAENRPIDGIDLWGLQYVNVTTGSGSGPVDVNNVSDTVAEEYDVNNNGVQDYYLPPVEVTPNTNPESGLINSAGLLSAVAQSHIDDLPNGVIGVKPTLTWDGTYTTNKSSSFKPSRRTNRPHKQRASWTKNYNPYSADVTVSGNFNKPALSAINRTVGNGLTVTSLALTGNQYRTGEITGFQASVETGVTGVLHRYPNQFTIAAGIGWEAGRVITQTQGYQNVKDNIRSRIQAYNDDPSRIELLSQ